MSELADLWAAQAELARDPEDLGAWHRVATGLTEAGDKKAGALALGELGHAAGNAGFLPLALLAARDLTALDAAASKKLVADLAALYSRGAKRLDAHARPHPPGAPGQADPGALPKTEAVLEASRKAAVAAAAHARRAAAVGDLPVPAYPLFAALDANTFADFAQLLQPRRLHAGDQVIVQGQAGQSIFIIARGAVRIHRGETTLATLRGGQLFGEMALLTAQPRSASATCETDTVVFEVAQKGLEALATREPAVATVLAEYARRRLLENLLATSPLFRDLPAGERTQVMARFRTRTSEAGTVLLAEGKEGDGLHVIVTGGAVVEKVEGKDKLRLAELGPGDVLGEISLVRARPATATVRTTGKTVTLMLPRAEFDEVAKSHPALVGAAFALATEREKSTAAALGAAATPADEFLV
jgi:cAMP-dependent protein kinase regulator